MAQVTKPTFREPFSAGCLCLSSSKDGRQKDLKGKMAFRAGAKIDNELE